VKSKKLSKLAAEIAGGLQGVAVRGALIFAVPIGHILRGVHFEGSGFDSDAFYANAFFQPLCVPSEIVHFTFGFRIRSTSGIDGWSSLDHQLVEQLRQSIVVQALPFLTSTETFNGAAKAAGLMNSGNPHVLEAMAYCLLLAGNSNHAVRTLDQLRAAVDNSVPWQREVAGRATVIAQLAVQRPEDACKQLSAWEAETVRKLGFTDAEPAHPLVQTRSPTSPEGPRS
jgi:hypothetical protein